MRSGDRQSEPAGTLLYGYSGAEHRSE